MPIRVVVCDDEPHITRAISMKLAKAGFEVETAADGEAGWEAISRALPALVITDYQMPRLNGLELYRRLRGTPGAENLPIILLTAKGFELADDDQLQDLAFAHVLVKPFSPRELLKTVQETLGIAASVS
jgi:DNA-binding response OmpR family regulator